jgi:hypothetical protein
MRNKALTLSDFKLTVAEARSPLWQRLEQCLAGELAYQRQQNDAMEDIAKTTLRRGQIAVVKRILALSDEVGPESSASEAHSPESQSAGDVAGSPLEL